MTENDDTEDFAKKNLTPEQYKKNVEARKENEASEDKAVKEYAQRILHEPCIICGKKIPDHEPFTELFACMNKLDSHKAKLKTWFSANLKIGETTNGKHINKSED